MTRSPGMLRARATGEIRYDSGGWSGRDDQEMLINTGSALNWLHLNTNPFVEH